MACECESEDGVDEATVEGLADEGPAWVGIIIEISGVV